MNFRQNIFFKQLTESNEQRPEKNGKDMYDFILCYVYIYIINYVIIYIINYIS